MVFAEMTPNELREQNIVQNGVVYGFDKAWMFYDADFEPVFYRFDFRNPARSVPVMEFEFVPRDGLTPKTAGKTLVCDSETFVVES